MSLHDRAVGYFYSRIDFFKNPNEFLISILESTECDEKSPTNPITCVCKRMWIWIVVKMLWIVWHLVEHPRDVYDNVNIFVSLFGL